MNGSTFARVMTAAATLAASATLTLGTADADEPPTPLQNGLAALTADAEADPSVRAGVETLTHYTDAADIAALREVGNSFTPFAYAAPTFGCGSLAPVTTIIAAATTDGPVPAQSLNVEPGTLRFSATPAHSGSPLASGLVVAWVNVNNGRSGIAPLDDRTEYNMPSLSKTVDSGPGTVLASMWGVIDYPGSSCTMTPTVGLFSVPDAPLNPPAPAPAPPAAGQDPKLITPGPAGTETGPLPEAPPAPAPA